jgi:hypothetical protein
MGQHVIAVINNIPGLYLKKIGAFHEGAKWTIENVPESLIRKAIAKETAQNSKGKIVPVCSFMTPEGAMIGIDQAYLPSFKHGKAPIPPAPAVEFQSKKKRGVDEEPAELDEEVTKAENERLALESEENGDEIETEESEENADENVEESSEEVTVSKKKKLKKAKRSEK